MSAGLAWYSQPRTTFLADQVPAVVGQLASAAAEQGLHVEQEQHHEWLSSIGLLQEQLVERARELEILKEALSAPDLCDYQHVVLEYDFRRRGLRMDCILLGKGVIAVVEFKRSRFTAADCEQVTSYCLNLVEFHAETRRACDEENCIVAPVLALTTSTDVGPTAVTGAFHRDPWGSVLRDVLKCGSSRLHHALRSVLAARKAAHPVHCDRWLASKFSPSSTILDAAISLYGNHDVSAISTHAAPVALIDRCTAEVGELIERTRREQVNRIVFVSGAPGAGKTLVGLKLAFDPRFREDAVFVTGNAPLVEVLSEALRGAYRARVKQQSAGVSVLSGYSHEAAHQVIQMSTFKLVKAHAFLARRGSATGSADGRVVIFDEAQRTYEEGRTVARQSLPADEAQLILESLERSYGSGITVVALIGHNQAINRGEMGIRAWFKAAAARGWRYAISRETLQLSEFAESGAGAGDSAREVLKNGHLPHSLRYYRNGDIERWAEHVLADDPSSAATVAAKLDLSGDTLWLVRDLALARTWVRARRVGEEKGGLIASGQARRLAAEGLFVDHKPNIAKWMLAPTGDIRSSNMLETVQNQYQVQGLEIDYSVVCWDLDLRRENGRWRSYKVSGAGWQGDKALTIAKNGYRVLLTRARKGMVLFVPRGDTEGDDPTRDPNHYDAIADYLLGCGARIVDEKLGSPS